MIASDFDDTLVPWITFDKAMQQAPHARTVNKLAGLSPRAIFMIVTGRGLRAIQPWASLFQKLPLRGLILDNGKELYVNQQNRPATEWIQSLDQKAQDPDWQNHLKTEAKWDFSQIRDITIRNLKNKRFQEIPHGNPTRPDLAREHDTVLRRSETFLERMIHRLLPTVKPSAQMVFAAGESAAYLVRNDQRSNPIYREIGRHYMDPLSKELEKKGYPIHYKMSQHQKRGFDYYLFEPRLGDIHKGTALAFMLNQRIDPSEQSLLKGIITMGDNRNDLPMLSRASYRVGGRELPNYPIVSGEALQSAPEVWNHAQAEKVPLGDLAPGLDRQIKKIFPDEEVTAETVGTSHQSPSSIAG